MRLLLCLLGIHAWRKITNTGSIDHFLCSRCEMLKMTLHYGTYVEVQGNKDRP